MWLNKILSLKFIKFTIENQVFYIKLVFQYYIWIEFIWYLLNGNTYLNIYNKYNVKHKIGAKFCKWKFDFQISKVYYLFCCFWWTNKIKMWVLIYFNEAIHFVKCVFLNG